MVFFGLAGALRPHTVFLTDCGTTYRPDCLTRLLFTLVNKRKEIAGVTARQRVMNTADAKEVAEDTGAEESCCGDTWESIKWWLSPAPLQGFEFESTFLLNTAMFTMVGALPVLPGPCQLLWWKSISILYVLPRA